MVAREQLEFVLATASQTQALQVQGGGICRAGAVGKPVAVEVRGVAFLASRGFGGDVIRRIVSGSGDED